MVDFRGRKTFQERGLMLHVEHGQSVTNRHEKIGLFSIQVLYKIISTTIVIVIVTIIKLEKIISYLVFVINIFVSKIFITLFRFETMHINKCLLARFVYPKSCFYTNICNFKSNTLSRIRHVVGGSTSLLSCQQA